MGLKALLWDFQNMELGPSRGEVDLGVARMQRGPHVYLARFYVWTQE